MSPEESMMVLGLALGAFPFAKVVHVELNE